MGWPARLEVDGIGLEVRGWGTPGDAPVLVLLHEGLGSAGLWRDVPERLLAATGCPVLAWSRQGYGRSDPVRLPRPLDYMTREAALVGPVLAAAGVGRPVLIGHSDGASIAAIHAGTAPVPGLAALVLIAPHFFAEEAGLAAIAETRDRFAQGDLRARLARHHDDPDGAFHGWNGAWLDPGFRDWNIEAVLPGIAVPVLGMQSAGDPYGSLAHLRALEAGVPGIVETAEFAGTSHAPHLDHPDEAVGAIAGFLARQAGIG